MQTIPGIRETIVCDRDSVGEKYLCAYVVFDEEMGNGVGKSVGKSVEKEGIPTEKIRQTLSLTLPDYMIPAQYVAIPKIPMTPGGKVDQNQLPRPGIAETGGYMAPTTETEKKLVAIWSRVLGLKESNISVEADFFSLGGHSLRAVYVVSRIHKTFDLQVPLAEIFKSSTIRRLAHFIETASREHRQVYTSVEPAPEMQSYPLSAAQKRLYILYRMEPDSTGYNMPMAFKIEGSLDILRLENAFRMLIERHESFRTSFHMEGDQPLQRIHPAVAFEIDYKKNGHSDNTDNTDSGDVDIPVQKENVDTQSLIHRFIRPFDLSRAPLLRVALRKLEAGDHLLMVDQHHIISDGVSMGLLVRDFLEAYGGATLPPLRLQYKDYAWWQNSDPVQTLLKDQEVFWMETFEGDIPVLTLPYDYPRPPVQVFDGGACNFSIDSETASALKLLAADLDATLYMVLVGLYTLFLSKLSGSDDIVVGTPVAGRRHADLEPIVGMFVNTVVLRNFTKSEKRISHPHQQKPKTYSGSVSKQHRPSPKAAHIGGPGGAAPWRSPRRRPRRALGEPPEASGNFGLSQFLTQVKDRVLAAFDNQEYQFEQLVDRLDIPRDASRNPLFDTMFSMLNASGGGRVEGGTEGSAMETSEGLRMTPVSFAGSISKFDLSLNAVEGGNGELGFQFEYCVRLFKGETVERFGNYFVQLIRSAVKGAELKLEELEIITAEERRRILETFNGLETAYNVDTTVYHLFQAQAERSPDNIALVGFDAVTGETVYVTYRHLLLEARDVAVRLLEAGIKKGDIVALLLDRTPRMMPVLLGVMAAGAVYLPMVPGLPAERIRYMLADSGARIVVTDTAQKGVLEAAGNIPVMALKKEPLAVEKTQFSLLTCAPGAADDVYVIYTSGSTGRPKGVLVSHGNLAAYVTAFDARFNIRQGDVMLQQAAYSFDAFGEEVYPTLLKGGGLAVPAAETVTEPDMLVAFIQRHRVTIIDCSPLLLNELNKRKLPRHVHTCISGGDVLKGEYVGELVRAGIKVYNTYGPTEGTICATYYCCNEEREGEISEDVPIGKPIANYQVYILDSHNHLLPVGVPGMLCIGGPGVAQGYLNRPQLTSENFITIPAKLKDTITSSSSLGQSKPTARRAIGGPGGASPWRPLRKRPRRAAGGTGSIYKTGDLAAWLPDGNIRFLGRADNQVNIRGYRIEPGEIERTLLKYDGISEAVVLDGVRSKGGSQTGSDYLVAYIVFSVPVEPGGSVTSQVRDFLSLHLPQYMIPAYIIPLDAVPLTAHGKIDRAALPEPGTHVVSAGYVPPVNLQEEQLATVFAQVLGLEKVGVTDNFFQVGGDSIKAIQAASRLKEFNIQLKVNDLFRFQTIRDLVGSGVLTENITRISQAPETGEAPLTPIQHWFFQEVRNHPHYYNQAVMLARKEGFDEELLRRVFQKLIQHHDVLRLRFPSFGDQEGHIQVHGGFDEPSFSLEVIHFKEDTLPDETNGKSKVSSSHQNPSDQHQPTARRAIGGQGGASPLRSPRRGPRRAAGGKFAAFIEKEAVRIQSGMDLENGPLVRLGLFRLPQNRGDHLLIAIHHLVVDGVSWRILLEDIATGYRLAKEGQEIRFPDKTHSFRRWAEQLRAYAGTTEALEELDYWQRIARSPVEPLPRDSSLEPRERTHGNLETLSVALSREETEGLLKKAHQAYGTEINDLLLAALALAVSEWSGLEGIMVNLEGHGREDIFQDIDISRTVGWFTTQFPVLLTVPPSQSRKNVNLQWESLSKASQLTNCRAIGGPGGAAPWPSESPRRAAGGKTTGEFIKHVKETLRQIPNKGIGYGILRYLTVGNTGDEDQAIAPLKNIHPEISFNYLGQFGGESGVSQKEDRAPNDENTAAFHFSPFKSGSPISPETEMAAAIDINGLVAGGSLTLNFAYHSREFEASRMTRLVDIYGKKLRQIIRHCLQKERPERTPSDLDYPGFSIQNLDLLQQETAQLLDGARIDNIFPLAPMQAGLFFHYLMDSDTGAYFEQNIIDLGGDIDVSLLSQSFQLLVDRYDVFRTLYRQGEGQEPFQVILSPWTVALEITFQDLSPLPAEERQQALAAAKEADAQRKFKLEKELPMRILLFKTSAQTHRLIWSHHHLTMDGWCMGIVFKDLIHLYQKLKKGTPHQLPPAPTYTHYLRWLARQNQETGLNFWKEYLAGYQQPVGLVGERERASGGPPGALTQRAPGGGSPWTPYSPSGSDSGLEAYRVSEIVFRVDEGVTSRLEEIAKEKRVTVNTLFQVAWGVLLQIYNSSDDVLFGSVVSGRPPEIDRIEEMVGLFINTVPVRIKREPRDSFTQLVERTQEETVAARDFQYLPLSHIQAVTTLKNNLIHHILAFENYPVQEKVKSQASGEGLGFFVQGFHLVEQTNYDFNIVVAPGPALGVKFNYNSIRYDGEALKRTASHLQNLLAQIADNPTIQPRQVQIITPEEQRLLLEEFNRTQTDYTNETEGLPDITVVEAIAARAQKSPHAIALAGLENKDVSYLTYDLLNQKVLALAHELTGKGVTAETVVPLMMEPSVEMVVAILGIMSAGGVYLPIDSTSPPERVRYILADSAAPILVVSQKEPQIPADFSGEIFTLSEGIQQPKDSYQSPLTTGDPLHAGPDSLAYIIYTSGTTGRPKGTLIEHRSLLNLCNWHNRYYNLTVHDRTTQYARPAFDASIWEIFPTLVAGASLYIVPGEIKPDIPMLADFFRNHSITITFLPTQFCRQFMETAEEIPSLRALLTGGDKLTRYIPRSYTLYNNYGPTENTVVTTSFRVTEEWNNIPIGSPVDNVSVFILDPETHHLQPLEVPGEICISGESLSRGYLNNPTLTSEFFQPSPFNQTGNPQTPSTDSLKKQSESTPKTSHPTNCRAIGGPGGASPRCPPHRRPRRAAGGTYKTGDLGRWMPGGYIQFLGRIDRQVKVRGFRIELGEIENCILLYPEVVDVSVIDVDGGGGDKFLCAYYVSLAGENVYGDELKKHLLQWLPDYMVPGHFISMESIPLNASGKVDRKALPIPRFTASTAYTAPRDMVENQLVELWREVLGIAEGSRGEADKSVIGIDENFFQLGGHSLKATLLAAKIHSRFNVKLPLAEIFNRPTIRLMGEAIRVAEQEIHFAILPGEQRDYYPLSTAQKRMFILHQMEPHAAHYNIPAVVPLEGSPDLGKLEKTFRRIIARHDSFRTSFFLRDGVPVQRVHPVHEVETRFHIEYRDLWNGENQTGQAISAFIRPFDLAAAPLLRVGVLRIEENRYLLLADMHHIISDGLSASILTREFLYLYVDRPLPPLQLQYKDYVLWLEGERSVEMKNKQALWWLKQFSGEIPRLDLPTDFARPAAQDFRGRHFAFGLDARESRALKKLASTEGASFYMVMAALYSLFLARLGGCEDVVMGTPVAGRPHKDLDNIVGMFVNTLAMRYYPKGSFSFLHFLREVKEQSLQAFDNQLYPFEELVEAVGAVRDTGRNPLFDVMLTTQQKGETTDTGKDKPTGSQASQQLNVSKFDLTLDAVEAPETIRFNFEYAAALFRPETIQSFARYFQRILSQIVARPDTPLSRVEITSDAEKHQVIEMFNDTTATYPSQSTIDELFRIEARRTPEHIAIIPDALVSPGTSSQSIGEAQSTCLTYSQLDFLSDRLAFSLRRQGVQEGAIIALTVESSPAMLIGLLGILKAGAAYMPIDPDYPPHRKTYMMADAAVSIVIASREAALRGPLRGERLGEAPPGPPVALRAGDGDRPDEADLYGLDFEGTVVYLEDLLDAVEPVVDVEVEVEETRSSSGLAYVMYTSGSTGVPKGVLVEHRNVVRLVKNTNFVQFLPGDRMLQTGALSFDASTFEIWGALLNGLTLCLSGASGGFGAAQLKHALQTNRITTLWLTAPLFNQLVDSDPLIFDGVRNLLVGGDRLSPPHINNVRERYPQLNIINGYGPTENVTFSATHLIRERYDSSIPIGKPIANSTLYILDSYLNPLPVGVPGEIYVGGDGVSRGYLNNPELTAAQFIQADFAGGERLYRTGDLGVWQEDGTVDFLGRIDQQVKIRGFRIEPGEITQQLSTHPSLSHALVQVREKPNGDKYLCAYMTPQSGQAVDIAEIRSYLRDRLPEHMVPDFFLILEVFPVNANGKIDRPALPDPLKTPSKPGERETEAVNRREKIVADTWKEVLAIDTVGLDDNYFEKGGNSLNIIQLNHRLNQVFSLSIPVAVMFRYTTIRTQAEYVGTLETRKTGVPETQGEETSLPALPVSPGVGTDIAIIGMAGRFPGAPNIETFWENLKNGVESISFFTNQELEEAGVEPRLLENPNYVKGCGILQNIDRFDASFFGYIPAEAEVMDPQVRLFHQCAWEALENAGYDPFSYGGRIGLYAGASENLDWEIMTYLSGGNADLGGFDVSLLRSKDFLATRVSYKLNLTGPSVMVQTACSTSLVAIDIACRDLQARKCHMALAGGVSVTLLQKGGYLYKEGMIQSPDGHCRPFDAEAKGTVKGNGVAVLVLKPLQQALEEGDHIEAVIKGTAVNNDGFRKVGYTAPSVEGQAEVIRTAQALARVQPHSIGYVETHGTATPLGDPVEIEALKVAFGPGEPATCALGAVKSNFGHLDAAAAAAGMIKAILALKHRQIPPTLHFKKLNPAMDLKNSPFYVNTRLSQWPSQEGPLRAGVSSFGIGGTNAHAILEEAPVPTVEKETETTETREYRLLFLSAKTPTALETMSLNLANYLEEAPEVKVNLTDVAYTLHAGRRPFARRRAVVCRDVTEAVEALSNSKNANNRSGTAGEKTPSLVFMFPGLGSQYENMGLELYQKEAVFRQEMDRCFDILTPLTGLPLREIIYPQIHSLKSEIYSGSVRHKHHVSPKAVHDGGPGGALPPLAWRAPWPAGRPPGGPPEAAGSTNVENGTGISIHRPDIAQLAVLIFEYALGKQLIHWGIQPQALIGYSFGEYAAALLADVFTLEDVLRLIVARGRLMESLPKGAMLSVPLPFDEVTQRLERHQANLSMAIDNGPSVVVAGNEAEIFRFENRLKEERVMTMRLTADRAVHSIMMEPIVEAFRSEVEKVPRQAPRIPFISNVTGCWITPEEAVDPGYWVNHLRSTVRFRDGIGELVKDPRSLFLEVGPGRDLSALAVRHLEDADQPGAVNHRVFNLVRHPRRKVSDMHYLMSRIGQLWSLGVPVPAAAFYEGKKHKRLPLPTYPFEENRFWPEPRTQKGGQALLNVKGAARQAPKGGLFYIPSWKMAPLMAKPEQTGSGWLVFLGQSGSAAAMVSEIEKTGEPVVTVALGEDFVKESPTSFTIAPNNPDHYSRLMKEVSHLPQPPVNILFLRSADECPGSTGGFSNKPYDHLGFYSLIYLAQAIGGIGFTQNFQVNVVTSGLFCVTGSENLEPGQSTLLGPLHVIPQEYPNIRCRCIDIDASSQPSTPAQLLREMTSLSSETLTAYRNGLRWVPHYEIIPGEWNSPVDTTAPLKEKGVYLITGGTGNIGLQLAHYLSHRVNARIALTARTTFPPREEWEGILGVDPNTETPETPLATKIRQLLEIEKEAAGLMILSADVADSGQMKQALQEVETEWGSIDGLIHAAGIVEKNAFTMVRDTLPENCIRHFRSKIDGLMVLAKLLEGKTLDFCWVMSSVSAILGGLGFAAYAAANGFMDAFIQKLHRTQGPQCRWLSVDWDGMNPQATGLSFHHLLALEGIPRVVVSSTGDLETRIKQWIKRPAASVEQETGLPGEGDENAAPIHAVERPQLITPYEPPQTTIQKKLALLWQNFFKYREIGIDDDFFELGGDSLKAVTLISIIHREMEKEIPIADFFDLPTIRQQGEFLETSAADRGYVEIPLAEKRDYYPLSSHQKRLYVLQQLAPDSIGYNISQVVILEGQLDKATFEGIFRELINRHEVYRTSFHMIDETPVQRVHNAGDVTFQIQYHDLTRVEDSLKLPQARALVSDSLIRPFDLAVAPLLRVGVIKVGESQYVLAKDVHHIISDGVSYQVFLTDFMALYKSETLPRIRLHYKDYACWQQGDSEKERLLKQKEYWLEVFSGELPVLTLPTDFPRPAVQSFEGNSLEAGFGNSESEQIERLAADHEATLFMVMAALYALFLSKLSGMDDIVMGTPVGGRRHADLHQVMGMFVNTLALRYHPRADLSFSQFLEEVKPRTLGAFDNQEYLFEDLVEAVSVRRDTSRNPLFDVNFSLQNMDMPAVKLEGLQVRPFPFESGIAKFDMMLACTQTRGRLYLLFEYCARLFTQQSMERFIGYFKTMVASVLKNPGRPLKEVSLLTAEERQQVLFTFNEDNESPIKDKFPASLHCGIHELFMSQAERTPDRIAVINRSTGGGVGDEPYFLSYRCFNRESDLLATGLREKGAGSGTTIALMLPRSVEMLTAIFAILKTGAHYLPIAVDYPAHRIEYMLADSGASLLITTPEVSEDILNKINYCGNVIHTMPKSEKHNGSETPKHRRSPKAAQSGVQGEPPPGARRIGAPGGPPEAAYILYTSGSTGRPKGVLIHHSSLRDYVLWAVKHYVRGEGVNFPFYTSISFDLTVTSIYTPLLSGNAVVLYGEGDGGVLIESIVGDTHVDVVKLTPSHLKVIRDSVGRGNIRRFIVGGEDLETALAGEIFDNCDGAVEIINEYGPTEATVGCMIYAFDKENDRSASVPIGLPAADTRIYLLDKYLQPVPPGVDGEIFISGPRLASGYLNRAEQTAETFLPNPFIPGEKMYRSGDLARIDANGKMVFMGRIDDQVKIRGVRIEVREIENSLLENEYIEEAVIRVMDEPGGGKSLCAYVVWSGDDSPEPAVPLVREYLSQQLPAALVPSHVVFLDRIPLTANGKVDYRSLPDPQVSRSGSYAAPRDDVEEKMAAIWAGILGVKRQNIGIDDSFFDLGGHSLNATVMSARVHKVCRVKLQLADIFNRPTIRQLAQLVRDKEVSRYPEIKRAPEKVSYPVSSAQKRLYIQQQLNPDSIENNMNWVFTMAGEIDVNRLEEAFKKIIQRHEVLRTAIKMEGIQPVQVIQPSVSFAVDYVDGESRFNGSLPTDMEKVGLIREFVRPFNLAEPPLMRVRIIKIKAEYHILLLDMHHIVSDGVSSQIMARELTLAYSGLALPPLKIQYKDYACWEEQMADGGELQEMENYWLAQFETDFPELVLPTDFPPPAAHEPHDPRGASVSFLLEGETITGVRQMAKETGATVYMVLLSVFNILLSRYSQQQDIVVGTAVAGRGHAELQPIIGVFVNMLSLRNQPLPDLTFDQFLHQIKENTLKAYENQDYPFDRLVEKLGIKARPGRTPLFDVQFNFNSDTRDDQKEEAGSQSAFQMDRFVYDYETLPFHLGLVSVELADSIEMVLGYLSALFKESTIQRMAEDYIKILQQCLQNQNTKLKDIKISQTQVSGKKKVSKDDIEGFGF